MTKIRTSEQLFDFTTSELAWRKKELQSLRSLVPRSRVADAKKQALLRSLVALTYAHWEGFVKSCASAYLEFVAMQRLKNSELSPSLLALSARTLIHKAHQSHQATDHIELVQFFLEQMDDRCSIQYGSLVRTESNLSSRALANIVRMLGLDYTQYETKEKLLDEKLLKLRNNIAHGQFVPIEEAEVLELHEKCIELMHQFHDQIDNAVSLKEYRSTRC